jgi:hypothetical protein
MSGIRRNGALGATLAAAALAVAAAVAQGNAASAASDAADPRSDAGTFRCEIQAKPAAGALALAAVVHAETRLTGSYSFKVVGKSGGGSSNINQGGPFAASAKGDVTLGTVSLGGGAAYTATLTVTANGQTATCSDPKTPI